MRRNFWLLISVCGMTSVLMASQCSRDEEAAKPAAGQSDAASADAAPTAAADPATTSTLDEPSATVDPGVEDDPLGDSFSSPGSDDLGIPEESDPSLDDGGLLDDPSFDPEPVPDEPVEP